MELVVDLVDKAAEKDCVSCPLALFHHHSIVYICVVVLLLIGAQIVTIALIDNTGRQGPF